MIQSMTAFARTQSQGDFGTLICEIRSINHRYLDVGLHLPELLRPMEMPIRDIIRKYAKRGKIECGLRYQLNATSNGLFSVNDSLVAALCQASEKIAANLKNPAPAQPVELLRFPGVLESKEADIAVLQKEVLKLVEQSMKELIEVRGREGKDLNQLFTERLDKIKSELEKVQTRLPSMMKEAKDKLSNRFHEAKVELDPSRLEQEMVMFAQKVDVAEEIDRTETHLNEMRRVLKTGGLVGRRLDFLLQELNREANTLGSKSVDPIVTHAAVEMKVLIEQIREQVQNVE